MISKSLSFGLNTNVPQASKQSKFVEEAREAVLKDNVAARHDLAKREPTEKIENEDEKHFN